MMTLFSFVPLAYSYYLNRRRGNYICLSFADIAGLLMIGLFFIGNKFNSKLFTAAYLISWLSMFVFRSNPRFFKGVCTALLVFSALNALVNLINLMSPELYTKIVRAVLKTSESTNAIKHNRNGYLCGLSGHYSRNAYFCVAGFSVAFSRYLSGDKKKTYCLIYAIIMLLMTMLIGKRGHFAFLVASAFLLYLLTAPSIGQKVKRLLVFSIAGLLIIAVAVQLVPEVAFVLERFISYSGSDDITNGRMKLYAKAIALFLENPILGIGHGNFTLNSSSYFGTPFAGVHNDYLQWLCELGIVGFVANMSFMIGVYSLSVRQLKQLVAKKKKEGKLEQTIIIWSVLFQTFVIMYSLTGLPHYDMEVFSIYYISCAVPFALIRHPDCGTRKKVMCMIK